MDKFRGLEQEVTVLRREAVRTFQTIDWRLDTGVCSARRELLVLKNVVRADVDNPPKILRVKTDDREYVSVRRVEGKQLYRTNDHTDAYESETIFEVPLENFPDGSVGVLMTPGGAECQNEELSRSYPDNVFGGWIFAAALADGIPYRDKDWEVQTDPVVLILRRGNKVYMLGSTGLFGEEVLDKFDGQEIVSLLEPDKKGTLRLKTESNYLSKVEREVRRKWHDAGARFYVMVEGSSETETRTVPVVEPKLVTAAQQ